MTSPIRPAFERLFKAARNNVILAAPFITSAEAKWVVRLTSEEPGPFPFLTVLTAITPDSVVSKALDISALETLVLSEPRSTVVNLPRLHAKVFVADERMALVTSANLTRGGLEGNYEYGVLLEEVALVRRIRSDLEVYARLGASIGLSNLRELASIGAELASDYEVAQASADPYLLSSFEGTLRKASFRFVAAQVGTRSANTLFSDAIEFVIRRQPMTTRALHAEVQSLLPELCDDSEELIINGDRFGKRWKHAVRNAQQHLKRSGVISLIGREWHINAV